MLVAVGDHSQIDNESLRNVTSPQSSLAGHNDLQNDADENKM